MYRRDPVSAPAAGGVCIAVSKNVTSHCCEHDAVFNNVEIVACKIKYSHKNNFTLICVYASLNLSINDFEKYIACLEHLCSSDGATIVLGDFNLAKLDWLYGVPCDAKSTAFLYFCGNLGFTQLVNEPTRDKNILDLVLSNDALLISDLIVDVPFCTSDHNSIHFSIFVDCISNVSFNAQPDGRYAWKKADWVGFCTILHFRRLAEYFFDNQNCK